MTFSIIARCPRTGQFGVAAATAMEWVRALQAAAAEVKQTLVTSASKDYARYAAAGLRGE